MGVGRNGSGKASERSLVRLFRRRGRPDPGTGTGGFWNRYRRNALSSNVLVNGSKGLGRTANEEARNRRAGSEHHDIVAVSVANRRAST
jgi:hypothetical protein